MCRAGHFANICRSTARQLDTSTASWLTNVGTDGTIEPSHVFEPDEPVAQNTRVIPIAHTGCHTNCRIRELKYTLTTF